MSILFIVECVDDAQIITKKLPDDVISSGVEFFNLDGGCMYTFDYQNSLGYQHKNKFKDVVYKENQKSKEKFHLIFNNDVGLIASENQPYDGFNVYTDKVIEPLLKLAEYDEVIICLSGVREESTELMFKTSNAVCLSKNRYSAIAMQENIQTNYKMTFLEFAEEYKDKIAIIPFSNDHLDTFDFSLRKDNLEKNIQKVQGLIYMDKVQEYFNYNFNSLSITRFWTKKGLDGNEYIFTRNVIHMLLMMHNNSDIKSKSELFKLYAEISDVSEDKDEYEIFDKILSRIEKIGYINTDGKDFLELSRDGLYFTSKFHSKSYDPHINRRLKEWMDVCNRKDFKGSIHKINHYLEVYFERQRRYYDNFSSLI